MEERAKAVAIVNPAAGKGAAARRWPAIQAELAARLGAFETYFTTVPGHGTALARAALAAGARRILAVGGDGTVNEALNGLLEPSGRLAAADAVLCPVPAGTANELCRALGYHGDPRRALDAAASGRSRAIDLLRVQCLGLDGRPVERFGYLIVAIGAAATVSYRTSRSRWLKKLGEIAYLLMAVPVTLGYRQRDVVLAIDGVDHGKRRLFTAMIGNTENGGGGMKLVPGARFDDGVLDLLEVVDGSRFELLLEIMPKLYSGAHAKHPKVHMRRGNSFVFKSELETLVDLDGETVGCLPVQVSLLPNAFNVGTP